MGKPLGRHDSRQDEIHELLVRKAREGKSVIRLKGGDPFLFGRGGEEIEYLAEHGVAFEVVPGVSSCRSAPPATFVVGEVVRLREKLHNLIASNSEKLQQKEEVPG